MTLDDKQKAGLELVLGGAIALVDHLILEYRLDRRAVADHCTEARERLEKQSDSTNSDLPFGPNRS